MTEQTKAYFHHMYEVSYAFGKAKDEREKEKLHRNQIDRLRQRVVHLVMDLRMGILEQRLKAIQQAMRQATGDMERVMSLMQEYKDMQELRNALARRLGKS